MPIGRPGDCVFRLPPSFQSVMYCSRANVILIRPILEYFCLTESLDKATGPGIRHLLSARGPSAVAWLIIAIVVVALNLMFLGRLGAHIIQEVLEISPTIADLYASAPIMLPVLALRVSAAAVNFNPGNVFWGSIQPVLGRIPGLPLRALATARLNGATPQVLAPNFLLVTAVAAAKPKGLASPLPNLGFPDYPQRLEKPEL